MNLNSRKSIITRLRKGKPARRRFVESHLNKTTAFQLRAIRDALGWNQNKLAQRADMNQNAISRLESPTYGKATLTTLKRLAAALDVCLVVRFVPFSEMVDWVSGTPRLNRGLTTDALRVPSFSTEQSQRVFDQEDLVAPKETDLPIAAAPWPEEQPPVTINRVLISRFRPAQDWATDGTGTMPRYEFEREHVQVGMGG